MCIQNVQVGTDIVIFGQASGCHGAWGCSKLQIDNAIGLEVLQHGLGRVSEAISTSRVVIDFVSYCILGKSLQNLYMYDENRGKNLTVGQFVVELHLCTTIAEHVTFHCSSQHTGDSQNDRWHGPRNAIHAVQ